MTPETVLTMPQLARAVDAACGGSRRADGRPTSPRTCARWCLHGRQGVRLASWLDVSCRLTTWGAYLAFRQELERVHEDTRARRRVAVRALGVRARRQAIRRARSARRQLEEMGAR